MEYNKKLEVFGNLLKQEKLFPVEDKIVAGSLVFESLDPFPGYYSDTLTVLRRFTSIWRLTKCTG